MKDFTYNDALDLLYSFINYEMQRQDRYSPEVMTLDRPRTLMALMGNPQNRYPIVHVAGTKGKGSVGAMCAAVLQAAGLKVGLYSSPHLQDFRERFRINHALIPHEDLAKIVYDMKPYFDQVDGLTWFEVTTALGFEYFAREKVDIAVIEVGLGGRLDATNVITPLVSAITSLSYDHMYLLGNTLALIAGEKAGIIKTGIPVVSAPQADEALETLQRIALERHAPLIVVGRDIPFHPHSTSFVGQQVTLVDDGQEKTYRTNLLGQHQAINTMVAYAALKQVQRAGITIPEKAFVEGFQNVKWAGRFEIVQREIPVIMDAAHNRASAQCLRETLLSLFPNRPRILVFGAKGDKDIQGMMEELLPSIDLLILTQAVDSRAESLDQLEYIAHQTNYTGQLVRVPVVGEAIQKAITLAEKTGVVCITGSLYVVGEARTDLGLQPEQVMMANNFVPKN
jgi:dihydrofolate synthase/folylpolyglutamate synthase